MSRYGYNTTCRAVITNPLHTAWRGKGDRAEAPVGTEGELGGGEQEKGKKGCNEEVNKAGFPKG